MNKRGQITIFIIVAIIVVGSIGLYFSLRENIQQEALVSPQVEPIYSFVVECIEDTGEDAIYWIAQNGGYYFPPEFSTDSGIPIYYSNGRSYVPYKEEVEENLAKYVEESLDFCLNDFSDFPESNVSEGEIKSIVKIQEDFVIFDVEYPLSILQNGEISRIKEFENIKVSSSLDNVYEAVFEIIEDQLGKNTICLSCISKISEKNEVTVDLTNLEDGLLFSISDESALHEFPLEWNFVNQYE